MVTDDEHCFSYDFTCAVWICIDYIYIYIQQPGFRLEAALLQTTWAQTEVSVANDLSELKSWADKWKVFSAQQARVFKSTHSYLSF